MNLVAHRIRNARVSIGLNQSQLARILEVTPQAVQSWEAGKSRPRKPMELCKALGITIGQLMGDEPESALAITRLNDAVLYPIVHQSLLVDNHLAPEDMMGFQDFPASQLETHGVTKSSFVLCSHLLGNSMQPLLPHNTLIAYNMSDTEIVDGSIYALLHLGEVRIKTLYRTPGGGIRLSCNNKDDYADERYNPAEMAEQRIQVLGKAFWYSRFI